MYGMENFIPVQIPKSNIIISSAIKSEPSGNVALKPIYVHLFNKCYKTVTCKVLLNWLHSKLGHYQIQKTDTNLAFFISN